MTLRLIALGARLGMQPGYAARVRMALLFVGMTICAIVLLGGVAVPGALDQQGTRADRLALDFGSTSSSTLLALDPEPLSSRRWDGRVVERVPVASRRGKSTITIPGTSRTPAPGQAVVSPYLRELMRTDTTIRALMSDYAIVGTITSAGLVEPRQLRAVIGVPATTKGLRPVKSVGSGPSEGDANAGNMAVLNTAVGLFDALLVGVPAAALVVLCARLGSRQRRNRIYALRRLGLSRAATRTVLSVEIVLVSLPAIVTGAVLYWLFTAFGTHIPGTDFGFFTEDMRLPFPAVIAALLLLLALAAGSAAAGVRIDEGRADTASGSQLGRSNQVGYGILAMGLLLFAALGVLPDGAPKAFSLWSAFGLLALGLALSASGLVMAVSRLLARFASAGGTLVGLRINSGEPGSTSRMASVIAALVVCLAGATSFLTVLNGGSNLRVDTDQGDVVVNVQDFGRVLDTAEVAGTPGVAAAAAVVDAEGDKDTVSALVATCAELDALVGQPVEGCRPEPTWLQSSSSIDGESILSESNTAALGATQRALPARKSAQSLPGRSGIFNGFLLVPPDLFGEDVPTARSYLVRAPAAKRTEVLARISSQAPSAGFDFSDQTYLDGDSREYSEQVTWLVIGSLLSLLLTCIALTIGATGESEARRQRLRVLYILGARNRDLVRSHLASVFLPLVVVTAASVVAAGVASVGMFLWDDRADLSIPFFATLMAASIVVPAVVALATLPSALRPLSPAETEAIR